MFLTAPSLTAASYRALPSARGLWFGVALLAYYVSNVQIMAGCSCQWKFPLQNQIAAFVSGAGGLPQALCETLQTVSYFNTKEGGGGLGNVIQNHVF